MRDVCTKFVHILWGNSMGKICTKEGPKDECNMNVFGKLTSACFPKFHEKPYYYLIIIYIEMIETTWQSSGDHEHTNFWSFKLNYFNLMNLAVPVGCFKYVTLEHTTFFYWLLQILHSCRRFSTPLEYHSYVYY